MNGNWNGRRTLRRVKVLFYGGLGLVFLAWMAGELGLLLAPALLISAILGAALMTAGLILASLRLRCPRCGESLCLGGRIPGHLPQYCPRCGKQL